jgi:hypothetical protein
VSTVADSVHLDLVLAADAEIDRQLDLIPNDSPVEVVIWTKDCACPRGTFEVRALQRSFKMQRLRVSLEGEPLAFATTFSRWTRDAV